MTDFSVEVFDGSRLYDIAGWYEYQPAKMYNRFGEPAIPATKEIGIERVYVVDEKGGAHDITCEDLKDELRPLAEEVLLEQKGIWRY